MGFHCHIYILDPSSSLFQTTGERALPVGTRSNTRHAEPTQKQTIDQELGIQDVTTIDESWYPQLEVEVASAVQSILDKPQPMDVDPAPTELSYELFKDDEPELLGTAKGSDSPVTTGEDRVLDTPARFSRAPGDGRPTTESSAGATSHKITGRTEDGKD